MCEIIEKNLYALKSIDNVIDEDLKNNLIIFNQNRTDNLESRLLDVHNSFMPIRDKKFERVLNDITDNKVKFYYILFIFLAKYFRVL